MDFGTNQNQFSMMMGCVGNVRMRWSLALTSPVSDTFMSNDPDSTAYQFVPTSPCLKTENQKAYPYANSTKYFMYCNT